MSEVLGSKTFAAIIAIVAVATCTAYTVTGADWLMVPALFTGVGATAYLVAFILAWELL